MKKILILIISSFLLMGCNQQSEPAKMTVKLYYYNPTIDQDAEGNLLCSRAGLEAVEREIPVTDNYREDTILLLLKGELTAEETAQGLGTEYPLEGLTLENSTFEKGLFTLEFSDPNNKTVGGSCRVGILWSQIEETAKQFSEVENVKFKPEELFQP